MSPLSTTSIPSYAFQQAKPKKQFVVSFSPSMLHAEIAEVVHVYVKRNKSRTLGRRYANRQKPTGTSNRTYTELGESRVLPTRKERNTLHYFRRKVA
jgi:hypothetical protein